MKLLPTSAMWGTKQAGLPDEASAKAGLTMIEMLIVFGIVMLIFAAGLPVVANFYIASQFDSEYETLFSLLQQARNQAMANINEANHGVHLDTSAFTVFEGASYAARVVLRDRSFPRSTVISISGPTDTIFTQLEGVVASSTFTFTSGTKTRDLYVNPEALIYQ